VAQILKLAEAPEDRIRELYLSTVSRLPDDAELATCLGVVKEAASPEAGLQTVLWGLLNTKEFVLQH
jgi:hypothetical protein